MTFESVEYPDEGTAETSAAEQARTLLASSRNRTRFGRVFVEHLLAECNAAVERADLAEAQVAEITAERTEWQRRANRGHVVAEVLRADLASANKRAETAERELARQREVNRDVAKQCMDAMERATNAERELAEMREFAGNPTYQWASSAPGFFFGPPLLDEAHVRRLVSEINAGGGHAVLKRRLVGDWTEVDDA